MRHLQHHTEQPDVQSGVQPDAAFTIVVSSGVTSSGLTLTPTEFEQVLGGGIALSNTVDSGGQVAISAGGSTSGDTIMSGGAEFVSAGAVAYGATVSGGGLISGAGLIDSATIYGFAAGLRVGPDDDLIGYDTVESGGLVSAMSIAQGDLIVTSAGSALATTVSGGGLLSVDFGGVASGATVINGGALFDAGEADAMRISAGAYAYVGDGGSSNTPTLNSATVVGTGAVLIVDSGAVASGTQIYTGATVDAEPGAVLSSTVMRGGTLSAQVGGFISGLVMAEGATATLLPGSLASAVQIGSGTLNVGGYAQVEDLTLSSGGVLNDDGVVIVGSAAGQTGKVVLAGQITGSGLLAVVEGTLELTGTTSAFTGELIVGGGTVELGAAGGVNGGSIDFDRLVTSGTAETVQIDAADRPASGTTYAAPLIDFNNNYDRLDLAGLALVSGATAKVTGDTLTLVDGSYTASFTLGSSRAQHYGVESDGAGGLDIRGAAGTPVPIVGPAASPSAPGASPGASGASAGRVEPDAAFTVVVSSGVTSSGLTLTPTEFEQVLSGGQALSNTVDSGGQVAISAGGLTTSDTVLSGGVDIVSAGAIAYGATVSAGGLISGAGLIDDATIYGFAAGLKVGPDDDFFGSATVDSGGLVSALSVSDNSFLTVNSAGSAMATAVGGGGFLTVNTGGVASGSVVGNDGALNVEGEADATRISAGGYAYVGGGGSSSTPTLNSATIVGGGALLVVDSGAVALGTQVYAGATVDVEDDAELGATVMRGGTLSAQFGGVISGLVMAEGATTTLQAGSVASAVQLGSGTLNIGAYAIVEALTLSAGGVVNDNCEVVDGPAYGQTGKVVLAGQITGSGLVAELSGGTLELTGNTSAFTGQLVVAGGTVELGAAGGVNEGSIDFYKFLTSSTETVKIDAANRPTSGTTYAAPLIDFNGTNDRLDLAGLALVSGATAKVSGDILTLVDGTYTASFQLEASRAQHYGVESDGAGGLEIRGSVGNPVPLMEAAASFSAPSAATGAFDTTAAGLGSQAMLETLGASSKRPLG